MTDRKRTVAAVIILLGLVGIVIFVLVMIFSKRGIVSPVPQDQPIKILFITPTSTPAVMDTPTIEPTESE